MAILTKKRNVCKSKSKKKYKSRTRKNKSINKKKMRGGSTDYYAVPNTYFGNSNYNDLYAFRKPNFNPSGYVQPTQNTKSGYAQTNYGYATIPSPSGYSHLEAYNKINSRFVPTINSAPLFKGPVGNLVESKGIALVTNTRNYLTKQPHTRSPKPKPKNQLQPEFVRIRDKFQSDFVPKI